MYAYIYNSMHNFNNVKILEKIPNFYMQHNSMRISQKQDFTAFTAGVKRAYKLLFPLLPSTLACIVC